MKTLIASLSLRTLAKATLRTPWRARFLVSLLACASPVSSWAQSSTPPTALPPVVVTASRVDTRADQTVSDVTVLTAADIAPYDNRTLPELLQGAAGIDFSSNGGAGQAASVWIRGSNSNQVLLLVDGLRYGSATFGGPIWSTIPVSAIERIEIIQGPASALYGSDAVGGVIQIFTRQGSAQTRPYVSMGAGSQGKQALTAGVSGTSGPWRYSVNGAQQKEQGFSATNPNVPFDAYNSDADAYRNTQLDSTLSYQINSDWSVTGRAFNSAGVNHFDDGAGTVDTYNKIGAQAYSLQTTGQITPIWKTKVLIGQSQDIAETLASNSADTTGTKFNSRQKQSAWQNEITTPLGVALVGTDRVTQSVDSTTVYPVTERQIDGVFVGLNGGAGKHSWQTNVRRDRNSQFGQSTTGFAGYGYELSSAWRAQTSTGTSFQAPTLNDLYAPAYPGSPPSSNPNLQPEQGKSYDAGLVWHQGEQSSKLIYFVNNVHGLIQADQNGMMQNIASARMQGWNAEYAFTQKNLTLKVNGQWLSAKDAITGLDLPRRAATLYRASADYRIAQWILNASLLNSGSRFDDAANKKRLSGFTTADVGVAYELTRAWTLRAQVSNLADVQYETVLGYNQAGRSVFLSARWAP